jgi:protein gp37
MAASPGSWGWWDGAWNPVGGCKAVSPGCKNCYAALKAGTMHHRTPLHAEVTDWVRDKPVFNGALSVLPPGHKGWTWPLRWPGVKQPLLGVGNPSLIFVGVMSDLFHEDRPTPIIDKVVATIINSHHIGLLLTKRAERMAAYFSAPQQEKLQQRRQQKLWLGFSAERQQEFDARWSHMRALATDGWTVFVSVAPMLGPVRLPPDFLAHGNHVWVICSGEEGRGRRYMQPDWARALRDQCAEAGVPFFMLQRTGRADIPADLFVRQFPGGNKMA